jgi:hypothetical protein
MQVGSEFSLLDGVCTDPLAFSTADHQRVPRDFLNRAKQLVKTGGGNAPRLEIINYQVDGEIPAAKGTTERKPSQVDIVDVRVGDSDSDADDDHDIHDDHDDDDVLQCHKEAWAEEMILDVAVVEPVEACVLETMLDENEQVEPCDLETMLDKSEHLPKAGSPSNQFQEEYGGDAIRVAREVCPRLADVISIAPGDQPPPWLRSGQAVVYIIMIVGDGGTSFYVGETEALGNRLKSHARKMSEARMVHVFPVAKGGKSEAKRCESVVIARLRKVGARIYGSGIDSNHVHFDRRSMQDQK